MKKFLALLLALVMVMGLATTAFAAEPTYTLTLENAQPGHTYTAFQIFAGDLSEDGVLSNIVWGKNVNEAGQAHFGNAAEKAASLTTTADAEAFAAQIDAYLQTPPAGSVKIADNATTGKITGLEAGYYLVKTTATTTTNGVHTYYIMKVVKDTTATIKADAPELEKTVNDADVNIGDEVTYTLTATMTSNIQGYEEYKVVFHDTLSEGLDFVAGSVTVKIGQKDVTSSFTVAENNRVLTITCEDVLASAVGATAGTQIVVTYKATVNEDANIGETGNSNKAHLEYSNNPYDDGTGKTPDKEIEVYTWQIPMYKYTMNNNTKQALAGAGFTLYKDAECTQHVYLAATEDTSVYTVCTQTGCTDHQHKTEVFTDNTGYLDFNGLESGTYYLKETTTPAGYNTCDVITVVIDAQGNLTQDSNATQLVEVLNQAGSTLPETGGMGTTMFYIFGGTMMMAAVVLLVTKKRMADAV